MEFCGRERATRGIPLCFFFLCHEIRKIQSDAREKLFWIDAGGVHPIFEASASKSIDCVYHGDIVSLIPITVLHIAGQK
ncbi:hypothetical protein KFK09_006838 [Dendrobium nobile]|uniref:Uncharacterized protein n=1 Tax=Dendrobium nobile TaxID=94219 RepID=A0A8T3BQC4_DENNO|nr:hypothetical protein KFK09_006838 [Dendrobium nobile]